MKPYLCRICSLFPEFHNVKTETSMSCNERVFGLSGPWPPAPTPPKNFNWLNLLLFKVQSVSMIMCSLLSMVYGLFKPCWLTHATFTCFKETALMRSCFVTFILCPTDKYMFKVNKLVFGNSGSSVYCQNDQFRKSNLLFDTYVLFNK